MKNVLILLVFLVGIIILIFIGSSIADKPEQVQSKSEKPSIPHIGSIELLNGCGKDGAAQDVANYLRAHSFDVKSTGNAPTWNYTTTQVVSRTLDTTMASRVASVLKIKAEDVTIIRDNSQLYDVTVFIGSDYKERIQ